MPAQILIVDDEPNIVVPLQFLMEQNGYKVVVAQSGEEALESVAKYKPALILLDIIPTEDGSYLFLVRRFLAERKPA